MHRKRLLTLIVGAMEIERRQSGLTISMPAISRRARCCCSWRWFIGFLPGASRAGPQRSSFSAARAAFCRRS